MEAMLHENGGGPLDPSLIERLDWRPSRWNFGRDRAEAKRQDQRLQERLYLDFMPVRRWLKVTTSARALAAAGVV